MLHLELLSVQLKTLHNTENGMVNEDCEVTHLYVSIDDVGLIALYSLNV